MTNDQDRHRQRPRLCLARPPAIAICLDGCEPAYLDAAIAAGLMPVLSADPQEGTDRISHSAIPSFTNPNNLSIATGRPPAVHGICGNYLYDPETGTEVMMNDVRFLRAPTIFAGFHDAGARVAIVTAKDKLRALLGHGADMFDEGRAICFSSERSDSTTKAEQRDRQRQRLAGPAGAGCLFGRTVGVRLRRRGEAAEGLEARRDVSDHHRLHPAQARARRPGGQ
jgi:phosphonoacetate hydrolase